LELFKHSLKIKIKRKTIITFTKCFNIKELVQPSLLRENVTSEVLLL